jgi:hypothetical protein
MEWEHAEIETKTFYKAFSGKEIEAHIAMKIGLRGVNITMKGTFVALLGKTISFLKLEILSTVT